MFGYRSVEESLDRKGLEEVIFVERAVFHLDGIPGQGNLISCLSS